MGLDAVVYCDCYEAGRLREPPPPCCSITVGEDGGLLCEDGDLDVQLAFDQWQEHRACVHPGGVLVHHYLGSIGSVALLREELAPTPLKFPMILSRVIYNGSHGGDFISYPELFLLDPDVKKLAGVSGPSPTMEQSVRCFESQMKELLECALRVKKPIAF